MGLLKHDVSVACHHYQMKIIVSSVTFIKNGKCEITLGLSVVEEKKCTFLCKRMYIFAAIEPF